MNPAKGWPFWLRFVLAAFLGALAAFGLAPFGVWVATVIALVLLAPLFCMGYYHTTRRRLISAYVLTVLIVLFILGFHQLPQPIRGLLDAGVVVGLTWGLVSVYVFSFRALTNNEYTHSPELPVTATS